MSTPERAPKRTRQACEPCRRKKSRCPGEKPTCSLCARLAQVCTYAPDRGEQPYQQNSLDASQQHLATTHAPSIEAATADRLSMLERGMAQIQTMLNSQSTAAFASPPRSSPIRTQPLAEPQSTQSLISDGLDRPPMHEIETAAELYARYCDCQPLPLFAMNDWVTRLASSDVELIQAVTVLAGRFDHADRLMPSRYRTSYLDSARRLTMAKIIDGPVELPALQTLCLLSLIEFNDNATARASSYSTLAWDLAQSAGLASEFPFSYSAGSLDERRRCYWSLVLLKNLFGNMCGVDDGILAYVVDLSGMWARTVRYAHLPGKRQLLPSWAPESEYQQILAQLMRLEARLPYKYRYKPARFESYSGREIEQHRTFWAPWYMNQMLYHSLLCLLNHPLILSLQLRNFRMTMVPEVFLQHTDDLIQTHTNWVIHLIDQARDKDIKMSNPYPSYCVAVVATIFLQQSYTDDESVRSTKQENFNKCLQFIRNAGRFWPRLALLAEKVARFQRIVADSSQSAAAAGDGRTYIDLSLFWEILESCFTSELSAATEGYFGSSLRSHRSNLGSTDVVNGRLLPPPTRLDRNASTTHTPTVSVRNDPGQTGANATALPSADDQLQVLAQSYFAQGQDFVNFDDWWYPEQAVG